MHLALHHLTGQQGSARTCCSKRQAETQCPCAAYKRERYTLMLLTCHAMIPNRILLSRFVLYGRYESIIATLCENLDTLDEPEAKASMIWIIGEYAERIDNADELLEQFLETFPEETSLVSLCLNVIVTAWDILWAVCQV